MANFTLTQDPKTPNLAATASKTLMSKGSHKFEIQGFSSTKGMGVGNYISSDTFFVGGHLWQILFYPDGNTSDESGDTYVSVFIKLVCKCKEDARVWLEYLLLDQNGDKWYNYNINGLFKKMVKDGSAMIGPHTFIASKQTSLGYPRFYKRTELEASQFIKNDRLTIQCNVVAEKKSMDCPKTFAQPLPMFDLGQSYGHLLESRDGSDIFFEVEGETFYAHKLILSTRSPVFKAQFFDHTRGIKIENMQAHVFKALLHFIYCDVIPDLDSKCGATIMTQHLLAAADRYGIEKLKSLCEARLSKNVVIDTATTNLALAEQDGYLQLKSKCDEFILLPENTKAVNQTNEFKNMKKTCPSAIAEFLESLVRVNTKRFLKKLGCGCFSSKWCLQ